MFERHSFNDLFIVTALLIDYSRQVVGCDKTFFVGPRLNLLHTEVFPSKGFSSSVLKFKPNGFDNLLIVSAVGVGHPRREVANDRPHCAGLRPGLASFEVLRLNGLPFDHFEQIRTKPWQIRASRPLRACFFNQALEFVHLIPAEDQSNVAAVIPSDTPPAILRRRDIHWTVAIPALRRRAVTRQDDRRILSD